jgi:hypothetical protein
MIFQTLFMKGWNTMSWNHILRKALAMYIVVAVCLAGTTMAATLYVDASVDTTGDGTLASPFKTIGEAITASAMSDEIRIAGGVYDNEPSDMGIKSDQIICGSYDSSFTISDPSVTPTIVDMGRLTELEQDRTFRCRGTASFTLENMVIQNSSTGEFNDTDNGGAIYIQNGSSGTIRGVSFINCKSRFEGGVENGPARDGGALCIRDASSVVIEDCVFDSCTAVGGGGAVRMRSASSGNNVKFHRCLFTNCGARGNGSVIDDGDATSQIEIVNCIFVNNGVSVSIPSGSAPSTHLIRVSDRRALIYNCTFIGNNNPAGNMFEIGNSSNGAASKEIVNCIFANNTIVNDNGALAIFNYATGYDDITAIQNNLFFSNSGLNPLDSTGADIIGIDGNIEGEPKFVDVLNGDYHLEADSPGVDAGQTLELVPDDFAGTIRPVGPAYDIGALEGQAPPPSVRNITATASSWANSVLGPEKTVDESGLDTLGQHDTTPANMWLSSAGQEPPVWIQYEFDTVYMLDQMWIWNSNTALETFAGLGGLGVRTATIEYSTDGTTWTALTDVPEFAQAPGTDDYSHDTTVNFNGAIAKFVRITCTSNWGGGDQYGLSEVRFFYIPVAARNPLPASGAVGVSPHVTLSWKAGIEAAEHKVYISDDEQAVIDGTADVVTVSETTYGPLSLDMVSKYYWRVDEVNNANTIPVWEGSVWSFTTSEYLIVDDFESYNDIPENQEGSNLVYGTWIDGYDNPSVNGSAIGYTSGASLERIHIHGGRQSTPLSYNNTTASYSEVTVDPGNLEVGSDWTSGSPDLLTVWFYGNPDNAVSERMYVELNGVKKVYDGDAGNIATSSWTRWDIELASFGINLSNVTTFTIGFERTGATGGSGTVIIDDIRLYSQR